MTPQRKKLFCGVGLIVGASLFICFLVTIISVGVFIRDTPTDAKVKSMSVKFLPEKAVVSLEATVPKIDSDWHKVVIQGVTCELQSTKDGEERVLVVAKTGKLGDPSEWKATNSIVLKKLTLDISQFDYELLRSLPGDQELLDSLTANCKISLTLKVWKSIPIDHDYSFSFKLGSSVGNEDLSLSLDNVQLLKAHSFFSSQTLFVNLYPNFKLPSSLESLTIELPNIKYDFGVTQQNSSLIINEVDEYKPHWQATIPAMTFDLVEVVRSQEPIIIPVHFDCVQNVEGNENQTNTTCVLLQPFLPALQSFRSSSHMKMIAKATSETTVVSKLLGEHHFMTVRSEPQVGDFQPSRLQVSTDNYYFLDFYTLVNANTTFFSARLTSTQEAIAQADAKCAIFYGDIDCKSALSVNWKGEKILGGDAGFSWNKNKRIVTASANGRYKDMKTFTSSAQVTWPFVTKNNSTFYNALGSAGFTLISLTNSKIDLNSSISFDFLGSQWNNWKGGFNGFLESPLAKISPSTATGTASLTPEDEVFRAQFTGVQVQNPKTTFTRVQVQDPKLTAVQVEDPKLIVSVIVPYSFRSGVYDLSGKATVDYRGSNPLNITGEAAFELDTGGKTILLEAAGASGRSDTASFSGKANYNTATGFGLSASSITSYDLSRYGSVNVTGTAALDVNTKTKQYSISIVGGERGAKDLSAVSSGSFSVSRGFLFSTQQSSLSFRPNNGGISVSGSALVNVDKYDKTFNVTFEGLKDQRSYISFATNGVLDSSSTRLDTSVGGSLKWAGYRPFEVDGFGSVTVDTNRKTIKSSAWGRKESSRVASYGVTVDYSTSHGFAAVGNGSIYLDVAQISFSLSGDGSLNVNLDDQIIVTRFRGFDSSNQVIGGYANVDWSTKFLYLASGNITTSINGLNLQIFPKVTLDFKDIKNAQAGIAVLVLKSKDLYFNVSTATNWNYSNRNLRLKATGSILLVDQFNAAGDFLIDTFNNNISLAVNGGTGDNTHLDFLGTTDWKLDHGFLLNTAGHVYWTSGRGYRYRGNSSLELNLDQNFISAVVIGGYGSQTDLIFKARSDYVWGHGLKATSKLDLKFGTDLAVTGDNTLDVNTSEKTFAVTLNGYKNLGQQIKFTSSGTLNTTKQFSATGAGQLEWYGQSSFRLAGTGAVKLDLTDPVIKPFSIAIKGSKDSDSTAFNANVIYNENLSYLQIAGDAGFQLNGSTSLNVTGLGNVVYKYDDKKVEFAFNGKQDDYNKMSTLGSVEWNLNDGFSTKASGNYKFDYQPKGLNIVVEPSIALNFNYVKKIASVKVLGNWAGSKYVDLFADARYSLRDGFSGELVNGYLEWNGPKSFKYGGSGTLIIDTYLNEGSTDITGMNGDTVVLRFLGNYGNFSVDNGLKSNFDGRIDWRGRSPLIYSGAGNLDFNIKSNTLKSAFTGFSGDSPKLVAGLDSKWSVDNGIRTQHEGSLVWKGRNSFDVHGAVKLDLNLDQKSIDASVIADNSGDRLITFKTSDSVDGKLWKFVKANTSIFLDWTGPHAFTLDAVNNVELNLDKNIIIDTHSIAWNANNKLSTNNAFGWGDSIARLSSYVKFEDWLLVNIANATIAFSEVVYAPAVDTPAPTAAKDPEPSGLSKGAIIGIVVAVVVGVAVLAVVLVVVVKKFVLAGSSDKMAHGLVL